MKLGKLARTANRARLATYLVALWKLIRHPDTPRAAKGVAIGVLAYALSPIDLVPDFIAVLGWLDDLVLVPLGITLAVRLTPPAMWQARLQEAERVAHRLPWLVGAVVAALVALVVALLFAANAAFAAPKKPEPVRDEPGRAGKVVDGDTLYFRPADGTAERLVRIEGIDAPEICQAWGPQSRDALIDLVRNQELVLRASGKDEHGRTLARVYVTGMDVGDRLVRDGHAWSMRYKSDRGPYVAGERVATTLQRGLHGERGAQLPRDFRQQHGRCEKQ